MMNPNVYCRHLYFWDNNNTQSKKQNVSTVNISTLLRACGVCPSSGEHPDRPGGGPEAKLLQWTAGGQLTLAKQLEHPEIAAWCSLAPTRPLPAVGAAPVGR